MSGIFISYRRDDSAPWAGRLYERLSREFPRKQVFMDVDAMEPGLDFVKELDAQVSTCDVFLAIIGPEWTKAREANGNRQLDDPNDFVRIELASALKRDIRVIPVLIEGAPMPRAEELPDPLKQLANRNAVQISHVRFGADTQGLVDLLKRLVGHPVQARKGLNALFGYSIPGRTDDGLQPRHKSSGSSGSDAAKGGTSDLLYGREFATVPGKATLLQTVGHGLIAGALSVLIFHQGMLMLLRQIGWLAVAPWNLSPMAPFGVPILFNLMFWGALWGALFAAIYDRLPSDKPWLKGLIFGTVGPLLFGTWTTVALIKGWPLFSGAFLQGFNIQRLSNAFLLIGVAFGIGLGLLFALLRKAMRRRLRVGHAHGDN